MIMFGSTNNQAKLCTITGLKKEVLNSDGYPAPQFAFISEIHAPLGNSIEGFFESVEQSVYESAEYGKSLQAELILIDAKTHEPVKLRANMTGLMRNILNKLATQEELGLIKIELWNVPQNVKEGDTVDKTKRNAVASVYNNGEKIADKWLDFDTELAEGSIVQEKNKKGVKETSYHDVNNLNDEKWFDIKLIRKFSLIKKLERVEEETIEEEDLPF